MFCNTDRRPSYLNIEHAEMLYYAAVTGQGNSRTGMGTKLQFLTNRLLTLRKKEEQSADHRRLQAKLSKYWG